MAGKTIADRYRMTRALGDGTFGEVLLAQRLDNGERVAVKRLSFTRFSSLFLFVPSTSPFFFLLYYFRVGIL